MKTNRKIASCLVLLVSGVAMAATPAWKPGVVREVNNNYARVSMDEGHGSLGLKGHGAVKQYCTIEVGHQLVTGEREVHAAKLDRSSFYLIEDRGVNLKISGDTMTVKDSHGKERSFHVVKTLPDTPANMPDKTAFAERTLLIQ